MSRPDSHISPPRACAIIVTWQPELPALQILFTSLLSQNCPLIVVDNGSANISELESLLTELSARFTQLPAAVRVSWQQNRGLSLAMNEGLHQARSAGYPFVLLFDQDSQISEGFVPAMLAQQDQLESATRQPIAAIGPRLQDPDTGRRTPFRCFRGRRRSDAPVPGFEDIYETDFLISSGSLISIAALDIVGDMKADYFIDNIDLEWCFRAKAKGFALYGTDKAVLFHRIGESSQNPLVAAGILVQHSPLRSYYSTRNRIHLWRQPYAPFDWKMRDRIRFVLKSLWLVCFTDKRKQYWQQIRRGIKDSGALS